MTVGNAFDDSVEYYDRWMKTALPRYEELFTIAVDLIPYEVDSPILVLDLGAGTGLFSQHVLNNFSNGQFVLYDVAPKMLAVARLRFQNCLDQFQFAEIDYRNLQCRNRPLFDVVISSLSIHHLNQDEKRQLFADIYKCLRKGGVFINVDQIKGPTKPLRELYWSNWLDHVRGQDASEEQIRASMDRRKAYDKDDLLIDQLRWLEKAGFSQVDLIYKHYFMGVFYAQK